MSSEFDRMMDKFNWGDPNEQSDLPTHLTADLGYRVNWAARFEGFVGRYLAAKTAQDEYFSELVAKPLLIRDIVGMRVVIEKSTAEEEMRWNNIRTEKERSLLQAIGAGTLAGMSRDAIVWKIEIKASQESEERLRQKPWHWTKLGQQKTETD